MSLRRQAGNERRKYEQGPLGGGKESNRATEEGGGRRAPV